jgi:hypothetical protein
MKNTGEQRSNRRGFKWDREGAIMVDAPGETIRDLNKYIFISKMLRCRNTKKEEKCRVYYV